MKITLLHCTYRFLSFLTDRTKGFSLFSKWKITLGSLLIGTTVVSCKQPATEKKTPDIEPKKDTITDLSSCYVSDIIKDTVTSIPVSLKVAPGKKETRLQHVDTIDIHKVYEIVDEMPQFVGGPEALSSYMKTNMRYPEIALHSGIFGTVDVGFVIERNGHVSDVTLLSSLFRDCDQEAFRLVRSMPPWNPGKIQGKPVRTLCQLSVSFTEELVVSFMTENPMPLATCYTGVLPNRIHIKEEEKIARFVKKHLRIPPGKKDIPGTVLVQVEVNLHGKITKAEVVQSLDEALDNEAIRVVKKIPSSLLVRKTGKGEPYDRMIPVAFGQNNEN